MNAVEKNKEYTIEIEAVSSDGNGVGHINGFAVFVPQTTAGDIVRILAVKIQKRFAYGKLLEILVPSPHRQDADCPHYKRCGGCQLRHISYTKQLEIKKDIIENAMRRIGGFKTFSTDEIIGMNKPARYRNKMVFPIGHMNGENICGFYAQRSHDIIPLTDCVIGDEINAEINRAVISYMNENNISAYDEKTHKGMIRRVFTRKAFSTGDMMVVISANTEKLPECERLITSLRSISQRIVSIILNVNTKRNNLVLGDKNICLWGEDNIIDTLCGIKFAISAQSFYQVNPAQTEKLYDKALEYASLDKSMHVMDIYCGIGTISLCAAKHAGSVTGIEIVKKAIEDAKQNAKVNNITNVVFYADSAENIVPKLISHGENPHVVILDPPRKGSDEATLSAIVTAHPKRIVYVSCNPATLARDARFLADSGYTITRSCGVDLFPHTMHVETVILFEK